MDNKTIYLAPASIASFSTEIIEIKCPEVKNIFRIKIKSGLATTGFGGICESFYYVNFDFTKEGFKVKEKADEVVKRLIEMIRHPITCNTIVKLTLIQYGNYEIEFI